MRGFIQEPEPASLREKLHSLVFESDLSAVGLRRLAVLLVSVAAVKIVFLIGLAALAGLALSFWISGRNEAISLSDSEDGLRAAETARRAALAKVMARDAERIVDDAYNKARAAQQESWTRKLASDVQSSLQNTAVAMVAYYTDHHNSFTADYSDLLNYGWRPDPNLIYDPIKLVPGAEGRMNFIITARHRQEGIPVYTFDYLGGRGVERAPLEASAAELSAVPGIPAVLNHEKEEQVKSAARNVASAAHLYWIRTRTYPEYYEDLMPHGWEPDPDIIYGDFRSNSHTMDGDVNYTFMIRHRDRSVSPFRYDRSSFPMIRKLGRDEPFLEAHKKPDGHRPPAPGPERAGRTRRESDKMIAIRGKEGEIQVALQWAAMYMHAYQSDKGVFTSNFDDLAAYGWEREPGLVYEDIQLGRTSDGRPSFKIVVRSSDEGPRAFQYSFPGEGLASVR